MMGKSSQGCVLGRRIRQGIQHPLQALGELGCGFVGQSGCIVPHGQAAVLGQQHGDGRAFNEAHALRQANLGNRQGLDRRVAGDKVQRKGRVAARLVQRGGAMLDESREGEVARCIEAQRNPG